MVTVAESVACSRRVVKEIATGLTLATARKTLTSRQVVISVAAVEILHLAPSEDEQWDPVVWRVCLVLNWSALTGQQEEREEKVSEVEQW